MNTSITTLAVVNKQISNHPFSYIKSLPNDRKTLSIIFEIVIRKLKYINTNPKSQDEFQFLKEQVIELSVSLINKSQDLQDSIEYANLIHKRVLPNIAELESRFENLFVLYKPKDTIGGDFYWMDELNNRIITVCADCTGHGVPGAMLSMIGYQTISNIILEQRIFDPGEILTLLHKKMKTILRDKDDSSSLHNGMDASVCVFRLDDGILEYANAKSHIFVENNNQLIELKSESMSIGDNSQEEYCYSTFYEEIQSDCWLYQFTDGFKDQFGGPRNKKFGKNQLKVLLETNSFLLAKNQKKCMDNTLSIWMNEELQTDDITIIGQQLKPKRINKTFILM
jgi:serine phosphatase RsbU (regulator of sigma subunit)